VIFLEFRLGLASSGLFRPLTLSQKPQGSVGEGIRGVKPRYRSMLESKTRENKCHYIDYW